MTRNDSIKAIFRDHISFGPSIALEKIAPNGADANAVLSSGALVHMRPAASRLRVHSGGCLFRVDSVSSGQ